MFNDSKEDFKPVNIEIMNADVVETPRKQNYEEPITVSKIHKEDTPIKSAFGDCPTE